MHRKRLVGVIGAAVGAIVGGGLWASQASGEEPLRPFSAKACASGYAEGGMVEQWGAESTDSPEVALDRVKFGVVRREVLDETKAPAC